MKQPSELLHIEDEYAAWCFDQACMFFGGTVEADMEAVEGQTAALRKGNALNVLRRYLGEPEKFRDIRSIGKFQEQERPEPPFKRE